MITTAATACNIRLIVEKIIASHTGMAYVEHNARGTPPHHGFSLLICVDCACVENGSLSVLSMVRCLEGITLWMEWLVMDQSQKQLRQSKTQDFFAAVGFSFWCRNPMLRFGVLPSVDVACKECCRCMQRCWFPQTLPTRQS